MLDRDEDILKAAEDWQKAGHGVALATVVETWGSAPRPAGSSAMPTTIWPSRWTGCTAPAGG